MRKEDRFVKNVFMFCVQSVEYEGDIDIQGRIVCHTHIKIKVQHTGKIIIGKPLLLSQ